MNNIQIHWASFNCAACKSPLMELPSGQRINRLAIVGSRIAELRQRQLESKNIKAKKKQSDAKAWTISHSMLELLTELAELGGTLDEKGFIVDELK